MSALVQPRMDHVPLDEVYEPEVMGVIDHFVGPGDVCIDVGASIGFFTCLLANRVGPQGLVYAFEPNGLSFGHLERNVAMRGLANVFALRQAVWNKPEKTLKLHSVPALGYTSVLEYVTTTYTEQVRAVTIDSLALSPRFIKIDCEMAELQALQGATRTLAAGVDCVVLEFNYPLMRQNELSDRVIRDFMHNLGYDMFLISIGAPEGGYLAPIKIDNKVVIDVLPHVVNVNVMFSTEEKVRWKWRTEDISPLSQTLIESSKNSSSLTIGNQKE